MLPSVQSALNKIDRAIKRWYRREKPFDGGAWNNPLCPVCGTVMKYEQDVYNHIMHEEHSHCPNHCYGYEFVTGSTRTTVGSIEIISHYTDDKRQREFNSRMINLALIYERSRHREKVASGLEGKTEVPSTTKPIRSLTEQSLEW